MPDPSAFEAAVAALNAQRGMLGGAAVDAAIAALRGTTPATAPTPAPAQPPPPTQRLRQLSILFVDVADSTHLLAAFGIEHAPAIVDAAVQRFAAVVQQHGGEVLHYTGDGLKAAFGTRDTREDEAERAVRAGLAILDAAQAHAAQLRADLGLDGFAVRVGIHTGAVVLGGGAEADRSAIGQAVHLAARMEQSAPLGRLRISQDTHAQVRGLFRVQAQPPLAVKGFDEPLRTWLVLEAEHDAERAVRRGIKGLHTPMIGRDAELRVLLDLHAQVCAEGSLRAAIVIADAGVGKMRLRHELLARLGLRHEGQGLLQSRAHPDGAVQAYGLLRQLVARWFGIADDLDGASARARLVAGLAPWLGDRAQVRARVVGQLLGHDFGDDAAVQALGPRELREAAFTALIDALHAMAAQAPLVLVLDDLHWADSASLDRLERLARPAPVPLLLVMLARPALRERCPGPLAAPELAAPLIELSPLHGEHGPVLAAALLRPLPDAPPDLHALLVQRAEGNPFYMEELLRMLIDDGVIDASRTPWRLRGRWREHARVPPTLVGVLQARLDALPADELIALQEASIVGPVFWDSALATIDAGAPGRLPALAARQLVIERGGSTFAQATELAFHHQLLHDVTYDTVLAPARRNGHARVARWLAERVADRAGEFLGITAEHFERAGDSAQALEYYDRARRDADQRYAHEAALAYADRALRQPALVSPFWRYQLHSSRQRTLEAIGAQGLVFARLAAQKPWREGGYAHYEMQMRAIAIESLLMRERYFDAANAVEDALAVLPARLQRDRVSFLMRLARAACGGGDLEAAVDAARRAHALAADIAIPRLQSNTSNQLSHLLGLHGDRQGQQQYAEQAEAFARASENAVGIAASCGQRADVAYAAGRYDEARTLWAEEARLMAEQDTTSQALEARAVVAWADAASGDDARVAAAADNVRELLAAATSDDGVTGGPWPQATDCMLMRVMHVLSSAGRPDAADVHAELRRRLGEQTAQAPDDAARQRVIRSLPWWRAVTVS